MEEQAKDENKDVGTNDTGSKMSNTDKLLIGILVIAIALVGFNMYQYSALKNAVQSGGAITGAATFSGPDVIPKGVPEIYGKELGVSFDDVSASNPQKADATIRVLGVFDQRITLTGNALQRYKDTVSQISCEYCCGAESIIFPDGSAACGCAHSYAMRGLAKYLLTNHESEYTNDEILEELGKWKTLFFPGALSAKAKVLQDNGVELNYINLASNKYRGAEQGASASGSMVGGC